MARDTNNDLFMNRIVYYSWSGDNTVVDFDDHQEFDNRISDENNEKVLKINAELKRCGDDSLGLNPLKVTTYMPKLENETKPLVYNEEELKEILKSANIPFSKTAKKRELYNLVYPDAKE
jgi:hypothetical protein